MVVHAHGHRRQPLGDPARRQVTNRSKILVFAWCYHGSVDEAFALAGENGAVARPGNVGPPVPLAETTRVAEFNDPEQLEASSPTATSPPS